MVQARTKDGKFGGKEKSTVRVKDDKDCWQSFESYAELKAWMNEQEKLVSVVTGIEPNPDTEPATKGYVKCLLRKTRDHTHTTPIEFNWVGSVAIVGWVSLLIIYILQHTTNANPFPSEWWAAITMLSAACTFIALDLENAAVTQTNGVTQGAPKQIRAYHPKEKCEKYNMGGMCKWNESHEKKECE